MNPGWRAPGRPTRLFSADLAGGLGDNAAVRPRILLVEDDPAIAQATAYALQREGLEVVHVLLAREARREIAAAGSHFDAALIDIGLPDESGLDLCRGLRAQGGLPIIVISARTEELDKILALEFGADDYLTKPFSQRELCARVRALLRRSALSPAGPAARAARGWIECDESTGRAFCAGQALALTRRELGLLQGLLQDPGRIWSRQALLDRVWGADSDSVDRTVDTHVKTLRAKLRQACPAHDFIATHRGMGYSLQLPGTAPPA